MNALVAILAVAILIGVYELLEWGSRRRRQDAAIYRFPRSIPEPRRVRRVPARVYDFEHDG